MSEFVSGNVKVVSKSPKGYYSIKVDEAWYGYGNKAPSCDRGDNVSFSCTDRNGFKAIDVKTLEVTANKSPATTSGGGGNREGYWEKKAEVDKVSQNIREYHAARSSAIELVDVLASNQAIKLPAKESGKYDAIIELVDVITESFYQDTQRKFYETETTTTDESKQEEE